MPDGGGRRTATFILIHGAWHGAWCWYKLVPRLEKAGHKVVTPDLPSLGRDKTPIAAISLDFWADSVCRILDAQTQPVILVGHSRGGIVISQAAERRPEKIATLVYLAAFLLQDGESLAQVVETDDTSLVPPNMVLSEDRSHAGIREEAVREAFYGCCPEEDVALARLLLEPEATAPLSTPLSLSEENFGRIPRIYIECLRDRAIPPLLQKRMYAALPCRKVLSLDTDHSPFFSRPDELAGHLLALASASPARPGK